MNSELERKLCEKFPKIFSTEQTDSRMPFPMFGIECGDGWYQLLRTLCYQIQGQINWANSQRESLLKDNPHNIKIPDPVPQVVIEQVKEKYASLRFYYRGGDERIDGMVRMAEAMSEHICETCGDLGRIRGRGWVYTACDKHTREEDKDEQSETTSIF